ncbi:MAG: putative transporter [Dysgonamonadaceae bacterium]|jgi:AspT/YidE/YbjL antiporter-like protein|nr:putative transporter [Dysgonamonadaceae bacterium]
MDWLLDIIYEQSVIQAVVVISIISAIGISLGKIRLFGVSLGITFVFFTGIIAGHWGIVINNDMLVFAENFGLILFVYTLGLQVGPSFFSSFKKGGIELNILSIGVIVLGLILTLLFHRISGISLPTMMGLLSGAVTNTPALGAAQQALLQINPENSRGVTDMALACAIAYPMGVVGVILAIAVMRKMWKINGNETNEQKTLKPNVSEFQIINPAIFNKSIREVMQLTEKQFVISRIWRGGKVTIPTSDTVLKQRDHLLVISGKNDVNSIEVLFGEQENTDWNKEDIDWNAIDSHLISRRIVVTHSKINGMKLGALRLRNLYGINITRVNRAGIDLLASPDLRLQIGDRLTIVGESASIDNVGKILGDEMKRLESPNLFAIFIGIALGVLLGIFPIYLPGMSFPVKLGIAGGPIIVGILVGAFGPRFHLTTYTTQSANLMMRQFGIIIYLAGLGLASGAHFFETVFCGEGLLWIGLGFLLTILPVVIIGYVASTFFKLEYAGNVGMLCGSMANPMALNYANTTVNGDEPSVAYATVYPLSMFLRVITAQLMVLFFT